MQTSRRNFSALGGEKIEELLIFGYFSNAIFNTSILNRIDLFLIHKNAL